MVSKIKEFFKDIIDLPALMFYILFRSFIAPMLWFLIIIMLLVFLYIVKTG